MAHKAIDLFQEIEKPDRILTTIFFSACAQLGSNDELDLLKKISSKTSKDFYLNSQFVCSLIDAFMKCGDINSAQLLFDKLTYKSIFIYGAMMKGNQYYDLSKCNGVAFLKHSYTTISEDLKVKKFAPVIFATVYQTLFIL